MICAGDLAGGHDTCLVSEIIIMKFVSRKQYDGSHSYNHFEIIGHWFCYGVITD